MQIKGRTVAIAASSLAIVQGVTWMILCFLGILVYFGTWAPLIIADTHYANLANSLMTIFAVQEMKMIIILFLYFLLSLIWISISVSLVMSVKRSQNKKTKLSFLMWSGWTLLICLYDLIVLIILALDYIDVLDFLNKVNANKKIPYIYLLLAYGILFSIAARGYTLWCINFGFSITMYKQGKSFDKNKANDVHAINAYGEERRRSFDRAGNLNSGFEWENNRPPFNRTNSKTDYVPEVYPKLQHYPTASHESRRKDIIPKLGKYNSKPQTHNIPPPKVPSNYMYPTQQYPKVPSPDYSPPNSPLKSALKSRQLQNPFVFSRNSNNRY